MTTWWVSPEQLNEEQQAIVDDLSPAGSHLIFGPPGSGKTNLLLLRGNYLYLGDQKNIEIIVFTATLNRFLSAGGHLYDFPEEKIKTLIKWERNLLKNYNVPIPDAQRFTELREKLADEIEALVERRQLSDIVECFLLDEAHDFTPREIRIFRTLGKRIFAVADSRQKVYSTPDCLGELGAAITSQHHLKYHYRIGKKLCLIADHIGKDSPNYVPMAPTCNYDEVKNPSSIERVMVGTIDEQVDAALEKLKVQLAAYPSEMLGILCPTNEAVQEVWARLVQSGIADIAMLQAGEEHPDFPDTARVCVSTVHSGKGLEFRAVHFVAADQLSKLPTNQRNVAFTAVTRAKTSLVVYHTRPLPGFFEQALATVLPTGPAPSISTAFGRAKK